MMTEFSPRESMKALLHNWILLVIFTLGGGLSGWGVHQFQPPLYESAAMFTVTINYNQPDVLDKIDNDHYAEDQMIVGAMTVLSSADVLAKVIAEVAPLGVSPEELVLNRRIFVERKQAQVYLIVRYRDPELASKIANTWAQYGLLTLKEAYNHALRSYTLNQYIKNLAACLQSASIDQSGICASLTITVLQGELQRAEEELKTESLASRGLVPAILFDFTLPASPANHPQVYQSQVLALAGALIGLLIAIAISSFQVFTKSR